MVGGFISVIKFLIFFILVIKLFKIIFLNVNISLKFDFGEMLWWIFLLIL